MRRITKFHPAFAQISGAQTMLPVRDIVLRESRREEGPQERLGTIHLCRPIPHRRRVPVPPQENLLAGRPIREAEFANAVPRFQSVARRPLARFVRGGQGVGNTHERAFPRRVLNGSSRQVESFSRLNRLIQIRIPHVCHADLFNDLFRARASYDI